MAQHPPSLELNLEFVDPPPEKAETKLAESGMEALTLARLEEVPQFAPCPPLPFAHCDSSECAVADTF